MARLPLATLAAVMAVGAAFSAPMRAHAGGASLSDEDISSGVQGPSFIGFVREVGGIGINDAKVSADINGGTLVTASDVLGLYKFPGFGTGVKPDDVKISCAKEGYKAANVVRRPHAPGDTSTPIEVDCYLQKQ